MRILIVDGQGGGIGKLLLERLRQKCPDLPITAACTNALATSAMLRAGATEVATGENAIIFNAGKADLILGAVGIICPNSMLGELTPAIAEAIAESSAQKILVPYNKCGIKVSGVNGLSLSSLIDAAVEMALEWIGQKQQ